LSVKRSTLNVERSPLTGGGPLASLDYAILQQCMHCGLCLPSCPTYVKTGRERNSPRGRIALMRAVADGDLATTTGFADEMSYCLGCLACTTACPAGVDYTNLLEHARSHVEQSGVVAAPRRTFLRWLTLQQLFMRPRLLRLAGRLLWLHQVTGLQSFSRAVRLTRLLPKWLKTLEPASPTIRPPFSDARIQRVESPSTAADTTPPTGRPRYRVAMLTGCVQDLVFAEVNRATVDVLRANGCEVVTPRAQWCCGSLHAHNGELDLARVLARRQLDAFDPTDFDAIISNAAGCGSHLKHYDRLLGDDPLYAERARAWSRKVRDISEWLVEIDFRKPATTIAGGEPATANRATSHAVTYHEACHLCHGQGISKQPREILHAIPGVELRECTEATWCCGSAGIYSITQPETAAWLAERKLRHLRATGATIVATANPGCLLHLANAARTAGDTFEFIHPIVLLAHAYAAEQRLAATAPRSCP
jgi:glycolate oxidase iron-sulfur subunit